MSPETSGEAVEIIQAKDDGDLSPSGSRKAVGHGQSDNGHGLLVNLI